jgi:hypothetical protein
MFVNSQRMGMDLAFPDICKTPPAMVPIPYPNIALGPMAIPVVWNVLIGGGPAHNVLTTIPLSNGDNAGLGLGLISQTVMSQARHVTCVPNLLLGCAPATRLTSVSMQNSTNAFGMRVVPSQFTVAAMGSGGSGGAAKAGRGAKAGKSPRGKSLREKYLGRTPGKNSKTGREVQARMRKEGTLRDGRKGPEFKASNEKWYPLKDADMAHKVDAVKWWNQTGRSLGAKSKEVRNWMLDSKNYRLDHFSLNRSAGAKLGEGYLPPLK